MVVITQVAMVVTAKILIMAVRIPRPRLKAHLLPVPNPTKVLMMKVSILIQPLTVGDG
jgi:hypothetical protein